MADLLGTFEQAVLLTVFKLSEDAYGRSILRGVETTMNRELVAGAIYATLDRLEQKSLLSSKLKAGPALRGGRSRRYYRVTAAGVRALNESKAAIDQLWHGTTWPLVWQS